MKYAVIDIGSNTVRLCAYQEAQGDMKQFINQPIMAKLGSKTKDGAMTEEGVVAACDALETLKKTISENCIDKTFVFATAALRNISNTEEVVKTIQKNTGLVINVLSGEEEAFLTFSGAAKEQGIQDGVIADIGGGSTELILVKSGEPVKTASFPIGSLTAFVRFVEKRPAKPEEITAIRNHVRAIISQVFQPTQTAEVLYGIGGAARTASELEKILYPTAGGAMETLETLLYRLLDDSSLAEESILKASPERLDTALPGVAILCEVAEFFGCSRLDVCKAGVREGYINRQLEKEGHE